MKEKGKFSIYSDEELMTFLNKGEEQAFAELYERYGRKLLVYFTRMLNFDKAAAEDALQELFMKIAEAPEKFDTGRSFKTWIFSVASNSCKNHYRHREVVQRQQQEVIHLNDNVDDKAFITVASRLDNQLFRTMLWEILNELPAEKKEVFILKYQEEKSLAEIAAIQNCPEGSVKSRLHYTLKILEEKLKLFDPQKQ